jgi:hypothetical protein
VSDPDLTKLTPGEWRLAPHQRGQDRHIAIMAAPSEGHPHGLVVATVWGHTTPPDADARILAAAKELYAACRQVLAWARHSGAFVEPEDQEVLAAVEAAVRKVHRPQYHR